MKCKYCQAELQSNSSVCPECGKDNLKDNLLPLKIVTLSLTCVVMLALLAGMVCYGVTGSFFPNWGSAATNPTGTTGPAADSFTVITADGQVTMDNATLQQSMNQVVATMGDHELTNRQLQLYYWMAVSTYGEGADLTKDLDTQIYDEETGKTYQEYCLEMAFEAWQEITLMADAAREAGYELEQQYVDELAGLEKQLQQYVQMYAYYGYDISTVDEYIQMLYGAGCNFATFYDYAKEFYLGATYWNDMMLDLEITDDQINKYYTDNADKLKEEANIDKDFGNLVDYRKVLILVGTTEVEGEDGKKTSVVTDENWAACQKEAQELYDSWLAAGGTEEDFIALVKEHSEDENTSAVDGLYQGESIGVDVRHILIMPQGATSANVTSQEWSEEAWAYAQNKAQEILDQYLAGELTEEAFGELAKKNSADGNASAGGLYTDVRKGTMVDTFDAWCFDSARQFGDTGIVKTEFGYHVMFYVGSNSDNWEFAQERQPGDSLIRKTENGYELLYFVIAEPAWYRYSRLGAQSDVAEGMLEELAEANPYTVDNSKVALTMPR